VRDLASYIRNNVEGIKNAVALDFYGSGPIEKATNITICRRFKRRGMSWYVLQSGALIGPEIVKAKWRVTSSLQEAPQTFLLLTPL